MILYTNGCSWTWGGGLDQHFRNADWSVDDDLRQTLVWPRHLSELLKADKVVNLSTACGSNQRIIRTTIDWITKQNKDELKNCVAVIQFSEWGRFEKYVPLPGNEQYENHKERWLKCRVDSALFHYDWNIGPDEHDYLKEEIKYINRRLMTTSPIEFYYDTIQQMYALKGIFQTYGVDNLYFWHLGQGWFDFPIEYRNIVYKDFNVLDQIDGISNWDEFSKSHKDYWDYERLEPNSPVHPSLKGHKQVADLIYHHMIRKGYKA